MPKVGFKHSEETKRKISENNARHWKNRPFSEEHKRKISESKRGTVPWNKDKKCPQIGKTKKGKRTSPATEFKKGHQGMKGENSPTWRGGLSFEPYGPNFNKKLKEQIRKRDQYRCQQCFRHQDELYFKNGKKYKLNIHHIDYNKKNNEPKNLISLCKNCHAQTNFGRQDWINYFNQRQ